MRFTYSWLQNHLDLDLPPQKVGEMLTMAGLELDALTYLGEGLDKVQVGTLRSVQPHPDADRLTLCQVSIGQETLSIVCGARNHRAGDKVAVARVGAHLPNGVKIKKGKIRGVLSEGMLCSTAELGLTEKAEGILILPEETREGVSLAQVLTRDDWLFEVNLTPNRGDCLGVRGIARELAALTGGVLKELKTGVEEDPALAASHPVEVRIEDREGGPRYAGRVIQGVCVGESPEWLKNRLLSVGLRSINNVVDVTNWLLMDVGHPMHGFDLDTLRSPVLVRSAREGETLVTLDGVKRELSPPMLVIADATGPVALAGIMGGEGTGVTDKTVNVFLEAAFFDPIRIARTGRRLGIVSDSRFRFERGCDPLGLHLALDLATRWIIALAGGKAGPMILADAGTWQPPAPISMRYERINALGGISLTPAQMDGMLTSLGLQKLPGEEAGQARFQPPSFRHDLRLEEDLLEEVVRLYGYDRVETAMPAMTLGEEGQREEIGEPFRRLLVGLGYMEAINYAFVSPEVQRRFAQGQEGLALLNPISEDQAVLRTTLTGGLVEAARRNVARGNLRLRLFEAGRVFLPQEGGLDERERVAGLLTGVRFEASWHRGREPFDFFDVKGDVESLLAGLGSRAPSFTRDGPGFLHPGRKALVSVGREVVGWLGELHPQLAGELDFPASVLLFELDCQGVSRQREKKKVVLSRYPAVERDFSFEFPGETPVQEIVVVVAQADPLIDKVTLVDLFSGKGVALGRKRLALRVRFQSMETTLSEKEINEAAAKVNQAVGQAWAQALLLSV